ncbi:MAG TPA: F0F1 ATP synthase subunit epsilon [Candidatus Paceibacterota bacterium]|nr:F0F1 ATP synthase subunit epsilon [Candidatus Paceibacterota bacterium]
MAKTFHLTIAKIGENLFDGEVLSASIPGSEGVFEILALHEALISELRPGSIRVTPADTQVQHFAVTEGGIAEVSHNQATILL